ncbi:MAG: BlaI/MecI/CopY family transcriptional regulator [Actinomycetota bacterium]|nr:BlaI/MecI/CopY family transcriptional regulator [Actinomycetota bacterium]
MAKGKTNKSLRSESMGLGNLEASVLQIVWRLNKATVKDVFLELYPQRKLAYTTIMTVLRRLSEKGILNQNKKLKTYVYSPKIGQVELAQNILESVVNKFEGVSLADIVINLISKGKMSREELDILGLELDRIKQAKTS